MGDILRAIRDDRVVVDGVVVDVRQHITTADAGSLVALAYPHLFAPLQVDFPAAADSSDRPTASSTRGEWDAYAASLGLSVEDLSSKGDVIAAVEAYEAGKPAPAED